MDLAAWLLEQIAEDEEWARESGDGEPGTPGYFGRVLAECAAKRRIVELHAVGEPVALATSRGDGWQVDETPRCAEDYSAYPCDTLLLLAQPYADRAGFREEWRAAAAV